MDRSQHQRLDSIRRGQSELDNHLIDEFLGGYISRREFVRKGTVLGLGLPTLGAILAACGSTTSSTGGGALKKGGKMTVAIITPSGAIDPLKVSDEGGLAVLGQARVLVHHDHRRPRPSPVGQRQVAPDPGPLRRVLDPFRPHRRAHRHAPASVSLEPSLLGNPHP